jgi:hypothetical protein
MWIGSVRILARRRRLMDPYLNPERSSGTSSGQGKRRTEILEAPAQRAVRCKKAWLWLLALATITGLRAVGEAAKTRASLKTGPPGVCPALSLLVFGSARA